MAKKALLERVRSAVDQMPSIVIDAETLKDKEQVRTSTGYGYQEMLDLGLSKSDLKLLERGGLAMRGYYPQNLRKIGTTTVMRKDKWTKKLTKVEEDVHMHEGWRAKWLLIRRPNGQESKD